MDINVENKNSELKKLFKEGDIAQYINLCSTNVENAFLQAGGVNGRAADKYEGHGTINIEERSIPLSGRIDKHTQEVVTNSKDKEAGRFEMQRRRLVSIKDASRCLEKARNEIKSQECVETLENEAMRNVSNFIANTN